MDEGDEYVPQNSMLDYSLMDSGGGVPTPGYDQQTADPYGMLRASGAGPPGGANSLQAMNSMLPQQMHPGHPYGQQQPPPQQAPSAPAPKTKGRRGKKAQEAAAAAAAAAQAQQTPQHPYGNPYGSEMYGQQQAGPPSGGGPQNPMHAMAAMSQNPMMARQRYPPPHAQQMPADPYTQQQQQQWYAQQQQAAQQQQYPPSAYRPQYPQSQQYPGAAQQQGYYPQQPPQRPPSYYPQSAQQQQQYPGPRYPAPQPNPYSGYLDQQQQQSSGYGYPTSKSSQSGYPADWQQQQQQAQQQSQPQRPPQYPPPNPQQLQQQMYTIQTEIQQMETTLKQMSERGMDPRARDYAMNIEQRMHYLRTQLQQMQSTQQQAAAAAAAQMAAPPMYPQGGPQQQQNPMVSQQTTQLPSTQQQVPTPQQQPQMSVPPQPSTSAEPVSVMQTAANQVQVNITPTPETSGRTLISVYHQYNSNTPTQSNCAMPTSMSSPGSGKDSIPPEPTPSKIDSPPQHTPQSQMMTPPQYASSQQTQVAAATSSGQPPTPDFSSYQQSAKPSSSSSTMEAMDHEDVYSEPLGIVESSTGDDIVASSGDVEESLLTNGDGGGVDDDEDDDEEGPSSSYSPDQAKADDSEMQSADEALEEEDGRQSLGPLDADSSDIPPESETVPIYDDVPSVQSADSLANGDPSPSEMTNDEPLEEESSMASESVDAPPSEQTLNEDEESMSSQPLPEIVVQPPPEGFPASEFLQDFTPPPAKKKSGGGSRKKSVSGASAKKRKKQISEDEDLFDDEDRDFVLETSKRAKKKAKKAAQSEIPPDQDVPFEFIEKRRSTRKRGTQSYKEKHDLDQEELQELMIPVASNDRRSKSRTVDDSRASTADGGELTPMPNDDGDSMAPSEVASELLAPVPNEWVVEKILGVRMREKKPKAEKPKESVEVKPEAVEVNGEKKADDIEMAVLDADQPETSNAAELKKEEEISASPDDTETSTIPTEASSSSTSLAPTPSTLGEEEDCEEFLIKFKNKSYLHCEWHTITELELLDKRAAGKITRFKTKQANLPFQTDEDEYFNEDFTVVERVLDEAVEENGDHYFFVKWRSLSYEECTWELASIVPEERVGEFRARNEIIDPAKSKEKARPAEREWTKLHPEKTYKDGNKLREYQFIGVDWLLFCWYNRKNCILADEMGLGKTVQTITFLQGCYDYGIHGPFLVVVPLSTLHNWEREFETWTNMNAVVYHGGAKSREIIQQYELYYENHDNSKKRNIHKFDALITTFEMVVSDCEVLKRIPFRVCVIDEAHRLKNRNCKLLQGGLLSLKMEHRVLLTGTPLQNNIQELFSLLNFLEPQQFHSSEQFLERFGDCKTEEQVQKLQEILKPMMLRRLKEDVEKSLQPKEETIVEVQLSNAQKKYYRAILERNFTHLCKGTSAPSLMNTMMELRKCCNHPFLINGAEENILHEMKLTTNCKTEEELLHYSLVQSSGKLVLIDKLLPKLRKDGHKVLIFSQMVRVLDILEEFLVNMNYPFERIDGNVRGDMRQAAIDRFSKPDSDRFVFLLCTRAGGLGINLTAADTVIIFDSDWNPQNDLQAQARCHRIGQKKMVKVYRLITANTYEREMFDKASLKLGLDKAVLQSMAPRGESNALSRKEVEQLLKKGAYGAIMDEDTEGSKFNEEDIDTILQRRTHTITLEAGVKGSTFAKATFNSSNNREDIDVNDPNFWAKWAKKANIDTEIGTEKELIMLEPRNRRKRFEENKNDEAESDGDYSDSEQGSTKNGRGKSTRSAMMNGGRKRRRGHDDDDDDYVSYTPDELAFNKSEFFKVEKLIVMWGWGRWSTLREQIDSNLSENDIEHIARTLLLHCIREYRGDEKTREFVWKLICPAGGLVGKGGYMPAPTGKKGQVNTLYQEGWAALPEYNPPAFAVDSTFQRHVHRHSNKMLTRVHHLQILGSQITGGEVIEEKDEAPVLKKEEQKEEEKELLKKAEQSEETQKEAESEETNEEEKPESAAEPPQINGEVKEEPKEADEPTEEASAPSPMEENAEEEAEVEIKAEPDSTEDLEKMPDAAEENEKESEKDAADQPEELKKEVDEKAEGSDKQSDSTEISREERKKVKRAPYDIANVPVISDPALNSWDWNLLCDKHLLIGIWKHGAENYEAIFTDEELCFAKKEWIDIPPIQDLNSRFKRLIAMYQRAIEAAIAAAQSMAAAQQPAKAYKWPKREETEFIRVLRIYGVKDDTNTQNIINWTRFKELSPMLAKKTDSELLEELYCVLAMCTKQQGGELSSVDQRRASLVDTLPKMKAEKLMNRLHLMRKIHAIITTGIQSIKTTLLLSSCDAMPTGWNAEQDEALLIVVDKFGLDNISSNISRVAAFQKIIRPEEKTLLRRVIEICSTLESGKWNGSASTEMIDDGPDVDDLGALFQGMQNSLNSSAETLRGATPTSSSSRRGRKRVANAVDPMEAEKEKMRVLMHQNYLRSQLESSQPASYSAAVTALLAQQMMIPALLSGQLGGASSSNAAQQAQQIQQLFNFATAAALATPSAPATPVTSTTKSKASTSDVGLNLSTKETASTSGTAPHTPKQSAPSTPGPSTSSSKPSTSAEIDYADLLKKAGFPAETRIPVVVEEDGTRFTGEKAPTLSNLNNYLAANPKHRIDFSGLNPDKPAPSSSSSATPSKPKQEEATPSTSATPTIKRAAPSPALEPGEIPRSSSISKPSTSSTPSASSAASNAPVAVYNKKNGLMLAASKCPSLKGLAAWLDKHPDYNVHSSSVPASAAILPKMYQERLGGENSIAVTTAANTTAANNAAAAALLAAGLNPAVSSAADLQMQLLLQQTMMSQALYGPYAALMQQPSLAAHTPTSAASASHKDQNQLLLELMSNPLIAATMLQANTMNPQAQMLNQLLSLDFATAAAAAAASASTSAAGDAAGASSKKSSSAASNATGSSSKSSSRAISSVLAKLSNQ